MRKLKWMGFVMVVVLVFFSGCTQNEDPPEDEVNQEGEEQTTGDREENEEIITLAEEFINQLNDGEYEAATENFDETMAAEIDADGLEELWGSLESEFGDFKDQEYVSTAEAEGY